MLKFTRWALPVLVFTLVSSVYAADAIVGDPFPLKNCPVGNGELGSMGEPVSFNHQGRDIKFCCAGCEPKFKAETAKYIAIIDAQIIEQQTPYYPLKTDVVSGAPLPEDAKVVNLVYMNRLVRLADQKSAQKFTKDPQPYLAKIDEAVIAAQKDSYPLDKCIISGEPLDAMGEPVMKVYANRLVQFCCDGCVNKFTPQVAKYLAALDGGPAPEHISPSEIHKGEHDHD